MAEIAIPDINIFAGSFLPERIIATKFEREIKAKIIPGSMSNQGTIAEPVRAKPELDVDTQILLSPELLDGSYVYVHCCFRNRWKDMLVRIWKTTYLIDQVSGSRSALIHAENISIAPGWTMVPDNREYTFLLIFGSLPAACKVFDLLEDIALPSGFHAKGIRRNETDVYQVNI